MPAGVPFTITLPVSVANGSITGGVSTLRIPQGSVESKLLTVTRTPATTAAVTVNIGALPGVARKPSRLSTCEIRESTLGNHRWPPGTARRPSPKGSSTTRSVAENTPAGQHIGKAIAATDADNDTLTYSLSGTDAASFGIDATTGDLKTKAPPRL